MKPHPAQSGETHRFRVSYNLASLYPTHSLLRILWVLITLTTGVKISCAALEWQTITPAYYQNGYEVGGLILDELKYAGGTWVGYTRALRDEYGNYSKALVHSVDGVNWTVTAFGPPVSPKGAIYYAGGSFYIPMYSTYYVDGSGSHNVTDLLWRSADGITWTTAALSSSSPGVALDVGPVVELSSGIYCYEMALDYYSKLNTSTLQWGAATRTNKTITYSDYTQARDWFRVGSTAYMGAYSSTHQFTSFSSPGTLSPRSFQSISGMSQLAANATGTVIMGLEEVSKKVAISTNSGVDWSSQDFSSAPGSYVRDVAYGGGTFVVSGLYGVMGESVNGAAFTLNYLPQSDSTYCVAAGPNYFLTTTISNRIYRALFPPAWHSSQLSSLGNCASGSRTGAANDVAYQYYYKGTDGQLWCIYWTGSQWAQSPLTTTANVSDWLCFHPGWNYIYYRGTDGHLWAVWFAGGRWNQAKLSNTANVTSDITVNASQNIIYYRGSDSQLWALWFGGGIWNQAKLSSTANVAGDLTVDSSYNLTYYRGSDGNVWVVWYGGGRWNQAKLTTNANVGGSLSADAGALLYYRSSSDNSAWAVFWSGTTWSQIQLDAAANMAGSSTTFSRYTTLYVDGNGQCQALLYNGSNWGHVMLGDGGSGLGGALSVNRSMNWVFARRSDSQILIFSYY